MVRLWHFSVIPLKKKERLGLSGRTIVSTVGFLSPAKGVDCAINAMKIMIEKHPSILFLVVGETHPTLRQQENEKYREELEDLVIDLGLGENVMFVNRFVSDQELSIFLNISDVYVAPYRGRGQVSSGTLTGAMAHGKAIVATPTLSHRRLFLLDEVCSASLMMLNQLPHRSIRS